MSENAPEPAENETPNPARDDANQSPEEQGTDELSVLKAEARKWEARAKANKDAAEKLAAIEEANKSEAQRASDRLAVAEKEAADARRDALRFRVAAKYQVSDDDTDLFLTGSDEETLVRQAERLTARDADRKRTGNRVPREGNSPENQTDNDALARQILLGH
jgi:hypothetical protein